MKVLRAGFVAVSFAVLGHTQALTAGRSCESLSSQALPDTTISLAQTVAPGSFVTPDAAAGRGAAQGEAFRNLPAFCRVAATLRPTSDSDIKIEIWMPASGWNGKFQASATAAGAGRSAIPRWARRCAAVTPPTWSARSSSGWKRPGAGSDRRVAAARRSGRSHASAVSLPAGRHVQRNRKHRRRRELRLSCQRW